MASRKLSEMSKAQLEKYQAQLKRKPLVRANDLSPQELKSILEPKRSRQKTDLIEGQCCKNGHPWQDRIVVISNRGKASERRQLSCSTCRAEAAKRCYARTPKEIIKERNDKPAARQRRIELHLQRNYNISTKDREAMWKSQNGKCAVPDCEVKFPTDENGDPIFDHRIHVEHDHDTHLIRGITCRRHNIMVGHMEAWDAPSVLQYLLDHGSTLGKDKSLM